jgi:hypothetical protein
MLATDGCASSSSNPACCFCDVWPRQAEVSGGRHARTPLVWACSSGSEMSVLLRRYGGGLVISNGIPRQCRLR